MMLTILTPCIRPGNLKAVGDSIAESLRHVHHRWYVIPDANLTTPIFERRCSIIPNSSASGIGPVKDVGIAAVDDGWIYILDDDNLMHPRFGTRFLAAKLAHPDALAFVFSQDRGDSFLRAGPDNYRFGSVDQAQFVFHKSVVGNVRHADKAADVVDDWHFFQHALMPLGDRLVAVQKLAAWYNRLTSPHYPRPLEPSSASPKLPMRLSPTDVAVVIGHYKQPGVVALNLHLIRKHNSPDHPILVTDDCSPPSCVDRLVAECARYNAVLHKSTERLGHVGGDLKAFYHGLQFAKDRGCRYLWKFSQRAIFDVPRMLLTQADHLRAWRSMGYHTAGQRAAIPAGTVAHIQTRTILLDVDAWTHPDVMDQLQPRSVSGVACESIVAGCMQLTGRTFMGLRYLNPIITARTPGAVWHDVPGSEGEYVELADREGIDLGPEFHAHGSNVLPDGKPDPEYW